MNDDTKYEILIAEYLAGECSGADKAALEAWIEASPANRRVYMQAKNIWEAAHPAFDPAEIDTAAATEKISAKIDATPQKTAKTLRRGFGYYWQRAAAVLLLPLAVATAWLAVGMWPSDAETAYNEVFAPYGTRSSVDLPDGSKVWINTGSSLKYPVEFGRRERVVSMTGEALFEVQADERHPFAVEVNGMRVVAKGTSFNINAYSEGGAVVTLVTGKVDVTTGEAEYRLKPRQQLAWSDGSVAVTDTETFKWVSWKDGITAFRDDKLSYVFDRLGQLYNVTFDIRDAGIGDYIYRATFRGETLDQILILLEMSAPIRFVRERVGMGSGDSFGEERVGVYRK